MRLLLAVFAVLLAATAVSSEQPQQILADCRRMLPERPVTLKGAIIMRSRKGIPQGEYGYTLTADRTKTPATIDVAFTPRGETNVLERAQLRRPGDIPEGRILKTDVTWLDLTSGGPRPSSRPSAKGRRSTARNAQSSSPGPRSPSPASSPCACGWTARPAASCRQSS